VTGVPRAGYLKPLRGNALLCRHGLVVMKKP